MMARSSTGREAAELQQLWHALAVVMVVESSGSPRGASGEDAARFSRPGVVSRGRRRRPRWERETDHELVVVVSPRRYMCTTKSTIFMLTVGEIV